MKRRTSSLTELLRIAQREMDRRIAEDDMPKEPRFYYDAGGGWIKLWPPLDPKKYRLAIIK